MKRYVVIPVKNNLAYTQQLVLELLRQGESSLIFVVDNGSTDGTREWLADQPVVMLDAVGSNIHQMWNQGLDAARGHADYGPYDVAILNNDLSIEPGFLCALSAALRCDPRVGVVGGNYDGRDAPGDAWEVRSLCGARYDGTGGLPGFAFMIRGEWAYRFPEELNWWYGDADLLHTVLGAGKAALIVKAARCKHLDGGGRTGNWRDPGMQKLLMQDRRLFAKKWQHAQPGQ